MLVLRRHHTPRPPARLARPCARPLARPLARPPPVSVCALSFKAEVAVLLLTCAALHMFNRSAIVLGGADSMCF